MAVLQGRLGDGGKFILLTNNLLKIIFEKNLVIYIYIFAAQN